MGSASPVERFSFASEDGQNIACVRWDATAWTQRGIVQIAHGMGEHIGRYEHLALELCQKGWTVYGHDHRGHGLTATSLEQRGDFGPRGFDSVVADLATLNGILRTEHPDLPCVLFGHSMGSFAAQQFVLDRSEWIDALVLSGSGDLAGLAALIQSIGMEGASEQLVANLAPVRTPFDWLSSNPQAVDAFIQDPLCFPGLSVRSAASVLNTAKKLANSELLAQIRPNLPIRFLSGSQDPIGQNLHGVLAQAQRYRQAGVNCVSLDIEVGARHELINEQQSAIIIRRLVDWIDAQASLD